MHRIEKRDGRSDDWRKFGRKLAGGLSAGLVSGSAMILVAAFSTTGHPERDVMIYAGTKTGALAIMTFCLGWVVLYGVALVDNGKSIKQEENTQMSLNARAVLWAGLLTGILGADLACPLLGVDTSALPTSLILVGLVAMLPIFVGLVWSIYVVASKRK